MPPRGMAPMNPMLQQQQQQQQYLQYMMMLQAQQQQQQAPTAPPAPAASDPTALLQQQILQQMQQQMGQQAPPPPQPAGEVPALPSSEPAVNGASKAADKGKGKGKGRKKSSSGSRSGSKKRSSSRRKRSPSRRKRKGSSSSSRSKRSSSSRRSRSRSRGNRRRGRGGRSPSRRRRSPSRRRSPPRGGPRGGGGGGRSFGGGPPGGGRSYGGPPAPLGEFKAPTGPAPTSLQALKPPASMAELNADPSAHNSGSTVQDQEIKVIDPRGQLMFNYPRYSTFGEAPFCASIQADLQKAGFPAPSQIQQYAWPLAMQGSDVIGVAATGSGKTLGFLLPAFHYLIERQIRPGNPQLLVMAPTRELAVQIEEEAVKFGRSSGLKTCCCYGGAPKGPQAGALRDGVHGVIGTPGRINDFLEGNQLELRDVCKLVLDEADRMLDMGFEPQIRKVLARITNPYRHTMFFTATWPMSIRRLAAEFLRNPIQIQIGNRDELKGNQDIVQIVTPCTMHNKNQLLLQVLAQSGVGDRGNKDAKAIIFCSTKRMCDQLQRDLQRAGVPCAAIHGDKGQREREHALGELKSGAMKLICATDVAARGIDIKGVTLVVNYDAPGNTEDYVHRIGRTGRAGQKGYAVTMITDKDAHALRGIIEVMKRTNQEVTPEVEAMSARAGPPPPSGRALRGGGGRR